MQKNLDNILSNAIEHTVGISVDEYIAEQVEKFEKMLISKRIEIAAKVITKIQTTTDQMGDEIVMKIRLK